MELNDHKARDHAMLSASSAHRWLMCPPSAAAAELYTDDGSDYAAEGTLAHEVAEAIARGETPDTNDDRITKEMLEHAREYADYIEEHRLTPNDVVLLESKVDFSPWVPGGFGTADCIIISGDRMDVIDYKYGRGVPVSAKNNPQLLLYAIGALNDYGFAYDVNTITVHIFQPRISNVESFTIKADDLMLWAEKSVRPVALQAAKGKGKYFAGEHCRFCPHAGKCKALSKLCTEYIEMHDIRAAIPTMTPWQIGDVLRMQPIIELWLKRVSEQALTTMMNGEEIPGFKVVEGRAGLRKWKDELAVASALDAAGIPREDYTETKILSPVAMDKALGKKKAAEILSGLTEQSPGKPTIAPETDKRPAYDRLAEAQKAFGGEI